VAESSIKRQASDVTSPLWFCISVVVFIGLGLWLKTRILTWIYGPLFPLFFLYVLPTAARRLYRIPRQLRDRRIA
jgi:NhaP-type Na+/H+ or K+/H+ antiporter